jgi:hypothetical protein
VDWCIHELVKDVFVQYWYQSLCNNFEFMKNKCQQLFAVQALLGAPTHPQAPDGPKCEFKGENSGKKKSWGTFPDS